MEPRLLEPVRLAGSKKSLCSALLIAINSLTYSVQRCGLMSDEPTGTNFSAACELAAPEHVTRMCPRSDRGGAGSVRVRRG